MEMELSCGAFCLINKSDFLKYGNYNWRLVGGKGKKYVGRFQTIEGKKKLILLHREIMAAKKGELVDHIKGNTLDNRKRMLRICNSSQNSFNRTTNKGKTGSKYKGVSLDKRSGIFQARIMKHGKRICLGTFKNDICAAKAYDEAAKELFGEFACLNFS